MAFSVLSMQSRLALMQLFIVLFCFKLGKGEMGIAGSGIGYLPEQGGGAGNGGGDGDHGVVGGGGDEPDEVVGKALQCFSGKQIYSSCDESYRLTESGQLNVPPEYTDEYCNGPCLQETHLLLNCIDEILSQFVFHNHATIKDVKDTVETGCGYGSHRGDFNVAQHIQSNSYKTSYPFLFGLPTLMLVLNHLF